jgi:3-oxoacyl-[acyl-carrier-protein] synthase II
MKIFVASCGIISAAGKNVNETLKNFKGNKRIISKATIFETTLEYSAFKIHHFPSKVSEQRTYSLLKHALNECIENSKIPIQKLNNYRVGVCFGTTVACQLNDLDFYAKFKKTDKISLPPIKRYLNGNLATAIKTEYKFTGPAVTVVNACTSGADAIGTAALWIKNDLCDIAVAGGADELNDIPLSGFNSLANMSETPCMPFDKNRSGLNLGEGAGAIILLSEKIARELNLDSNIELTAYSTATDGYHLTAPSPDGIGLTNAINKALQNTKINPDEIGFINAHGTATKDNDLIEGKVFKKIFKNDVKFISTKGFTGHTLGAAGAIEAIFTIYGLKEKWIPPNIGFETYDENIGINPISKITEINSKYAMSTSLAFGGNNSVLIFKKMNI